jgi:hypothetical protein
MSDNRVKTWTVRVWDGFSTKEFSREGTYEQVRNSLAGYPPGYIWSIQ